MSSTPKLSPPGITEDPNAKQNAAFDQIKWKDIYDQMGISRLATSVKDAKNSIQDAANVIEDIDLFLIENEKSMSDATKSKLKLNRANKELAIALHKIQLMETQLDEFQRETGRSAKIEPTGDTVSSVLPGVRGKGRLQTRRQKHRNGPASVRRHKSRRMFSR